MNNTYVTALIESLEKKETVLKEICVKNAEQAALLKEEEFSFEKFDKNSEEKGILIFRLNQLDDGFESVFAKVKEELAENRAMYAPEIKRMQDLITIVTDLSVKIQAEEARNKAALEKIFRGEREKLRASRSNVKAVKSYTQAMNYKL